MQSDKTTEKAASAEVRYEIRRFIGQHLVAYYNLPEPLPERLAELLKQFEQQASERDSDSA